MRGMKPSYPAWCGPASRSGFWAVLTGKSLNSGRPLNLSATNRVYLSLPALFRPGRADETICRRNETIFEPFEALAKNSGNGWFVSTAIKTRAAKARCQGTVMIKTLSAVAAAACIAGALAILPGFAPQVEASVPRVLAKGDRLDIHTAGRDCAQQTWPNFDASCLRKAGSKATVRQARLVTADRTP
jgi:hypothetical protein